MDYTADELTAMRNWLDDSCRQSLADQGLTASDLSDEDVVIGISTHHIGGTEQFLADLAS